MNTETLKRRFRATASFWESDRLPEPIPHDLDSDLVPSDPGRDETNDTDFQIRVETRIVRLPAPAHFAFLCPRTDGDGLQVLIRVSRDALIFVAAALHTPDDIESEVLSRWLATPEPNGHESTVTLPHEWTDWIVREGFDLWLMRHRDTGYKCHECDAVYMAMIETVDASSDHKICIKCPSGHVVYEKTVVHP